MPIENLAKFQEESDEFLCSQLKTDRSFRTPGKFKLEFYGDGMLACSSKLYLNWEQQETEDGEVQRNVTKKCHKGLSIHQNPHVGYDNYNDAIMKSITSGGTNTGLAVKEGKLRLYQCSRNSISGYYCKRVVKSDLISTLPIRR